MTHASAPHVSRFGKTYALILISTVYTLNFVDRALMQILLEPIRIDLDLTDTQLGFVTGIAFALFYAVAGLPISRWADRGDRSNIAAASIGLWGVTVMGTVLVGNFVQLFFARVAAAIGEAGCKPPTYSLIGDYFPGAVERTRAMSIYWLASPLAGLIAFVVGGWLNDLVGWRLTFLIMGVPGILLAILVKLTLHEPRRDAMRAADASAVVVPPIRSTFAALWRQPSARNLSIGLVLFYVVGYGLGPWITVFLIRIHGMGVGEMGLLLGLATGILGVFGVLLGGYLSSRWFAHSEALQMRVTAIAIALLVPCLGAFLLLPSKTFVLMALIPYYIVLYFFYAPTYTLLQRLVTDRRRAVTLAIVSMLSHLVGMGLGPQLIGILSDQLRPEYGVESLRYAMLAVSLVALWSGFHFWRTARTVAEDIEATTALNRQSI